MGPPTPTSDQKTNNFHQDLIAYLPLLWLSLAFLTGILFASQVHTPAILWLVLAAIASVLGTIALLLRVILKARSSRFSATTIFLTALSLVGFSMGAARYLYTLPKVDAHHIAWYNDRQYEILIIGNLADPPDERDTYTNLRLNVTAVNTGDKALPVQGLILARIPPGGNYHYGDVVRLRGHLVTPPENEDFSYRDYLAHQGILAYMPDAEVTLLPFFGGNPLLRILYGFKERALAKVYRIFPDPEASLLAGILLGNDNGLTADVQQAFKNTGTAHIIAISGFNIAIIAGLFVTIFSRLLGPRRGTVVAVIGIAIYTVLVGAGPSVVRAAIMGGLSLFAGQVGRRQNGLNTLSFTAAVMAVINPQVLWDVGFQLSFGATLGLVLYAAPSQDWVTRLLERWLPAEVARKVAALIGEFVLFTLAAQLTTLPIMAYQFKRISLISLLANPFILPAQPAVMVLGGLAVLLSFIYLPLGQVFAWIAWPFPAYTIRAVEFFNRFPHGVIVLGDFSLLLVILFYALLLSLTFARPRLKGILTRALAPSGVIATLGILVYLVWSAGFAAPDGQLHLTFLDVGTAEAVLIQTPSGHTILMDGGPSPSKLADALGRRLSPFNHHLDWLLVASTQEENVAALPRVLDRFPPENVLWAGLAESSFSAGEVDRWLADNDRQVNRATAGTVLDLGAGARLEVLSVTPRGSVLLVEWKGFRVLLPDGLNFDALAALENGKKVGALTALLLADSGYAPSNPPEWIANLHPQIAILSVAAGDPNGLPDPTVLVSLQGTTLLRTDRQGWIELKTDGQQIWVDTER